jgi:hypothetical protein
VPDGNPSGTPPGISTLPVTFSTASQGVFSAFHSVSDLSLPPNGERTPPLGPPSHPPNSVTLTYDARLAPFCCGSPAATLLFLWYEQIFRDAGYPPGGIQRLQLREWSLPLGFASDVPRRWFQTFYQIGTIIHGRNLYTAAVLSHREFYSQLKRRYVFYCMEVNSNHTDATLHRNCDLVEAVTGAPAHPHTDHAQDRAVCVHGGRRRVAQEFALRVQRAIGDVRDRPEIDVGNGAE